MLVSGKAFLWAEQFYCPSSAECADYWESTLLAYVMKHPLEKVYSHVQLSTLALHFMQYKPPKLKKKSSDQDATPSKKSVHPPGYHLVPRKSNFSGTYTLDDENSPERQRSYQSPYGGAGGRNGGGHVVRAQVPKSFSQRMTTSSHTSATPARDLPGIHRMSQKLY